DGLCVCRFCSAAHADAVPEKPRGLARLDLPRGRAVRLAGGRPCRARPCRCRVRFSATLPAHTAAAAALALSLPLQPSTHFFKEKNMEVILLERVAKLGQMGEIVKVSDGYARNFMLKRKKALRATAENRAKYDGMKAELEANNLQAKSEAAKAAEKIQGLEIMIIRQASESGQLFGSVSVRDIVAALAGAKVTV